MNHPLARALNSAGISPIDVAARLGVDPKTVQRWLTGRLPYPRHRQALAQLTGWQATDLWPYVDQLVRRPGVDEVVTVHQHRASVPGDVWRRIFGRAQREINILAYSALYLADDALMLRVLQEKARAGVKVRIVLGDPGGVHIARRGNDERLGAVMGGRVRNALTLLEPLTFGSGVELRVHDTVLYNSIYRADDEMLVNIHVYGCTASRAPVLHLRHTGSDGMSSTYMHAFERVWASAVPVRRCVQLPSARIADVDVTR